MLAERPERVRKLFIQKEINPEGIFGVNISKNGGRVEVVVDGFVPCDDRKKVCFSTANGNELWVIILEKVWAKIHGDYCRIIGGLSHETFRDMTGAPAYLHSTRKIENDALWKIIEDADKADHIMAGGVSANDQDEIAALDAMGLIA